MKRVIEIFHAWKSKIVVIFLVVILLILALGVSVACAVIGLWLITHSLLFWQKDE